METGRSLGLAGKLQVSEKLYFNSLTSYNQSGLVVRPLCMREYEHTHTCGYMHRNLLSTNSLSLAYANMKSPQLSFRSFISDINVSFMLLIYETKPGVLQWASPGYCGNASCVWGPRAISRILLIPST